MELARLSFLKLLKPSVYILATCLSISSVEATAGSNKCVQLYSSSKNQEASLKSGSTQVIDVTLNPGSARTFKKFVSVVEDINGFFPVRSMIPEEIGINIFPRAAISSFHPQEFVIDIPARYEREIKGAIYTKDPKASLAIFAHEYGHALFQIFSESIAQLQNSRAIITQRLDALGDPVIPTGRKIEKLKTEINKSADIHKKGKLINELKELESWEKINGEKLNQLADWEMNFEQVILSYNELFADIIAILYVGKPTGLVDSFYFEADRADLRRGLLSRDFSRNLRISNWMEKNEHTYFSPVRSHLGKKIFSLPYSPSAKKEVCFVVIEAIRAEIESLAKFMGEPLPSHRDLNLRLIQALDQAWQEKLAN